MLWNSSCRICKRVNHDDEIEDKFRRGPVYVRNIIRNPSCVHTFIVLQLQELVSITPNERNWRGICIALLVIVAVLALILFFIVLLSPPYEGPFNPGIKFTIDDVIGTDFRSYPFNGSWISSKKTTSFSHRPRKIVPKPYALRIQ